MSSPLANREILRISLDSLLSDDPWSRLRRNFFLSIYYNKVMQGKKAYLQTLQNDFVLLRLQHSVELLRLLIMGSRGLLMQHALIHLICVSLLGVTTLDVSQVVFFVVLLQDHVSQINVLPLLTYINITQDLRLCSGDCCGKHPVK